MKRNNPIRNGASSGAPNNPIRSAAKTGARTGLSQSVGGGPPQQAEIATAPRKRGSGFLSKLKRETKRIGSQTNNNLNPLKKLRDQRDKQLSDSLEEQRKQHQAAKDSLLSEVEKIRQLLRDEREKTQREANKAKDESKDFLLSEIAHLELLDAALDACINPDPNNVALKKILACHAKGENDVIELFLHFNPLGIAILFDAKPAIDFLYKEFSALIDPNAPGRFGWSVLDCVELNKTHDNMLRANVLLQMHQHTDMEKIFDESHKDFGNALRQLEFYLRFQDVAIKEGNDPSLIWNYRPVDVAYAAAEDGVLETLRLCVEIAGVPADYTPAKGEDGAGISLQALAESKGSETVKCLKREKPRYSETFANWLAKLLHKLLVTKNIKDNEIAKLMEWFIKYGYHLSLMNFVARGYIVDVEILKAAAATNAEMAKVLRLANFISSLSADDAINSQADKDMVHDMQHQNLDAAKYPFIFGAHTTLIFAISNNKLDIAKDILDILVDVEREAIDGYTALHIAILEDNIDAVKLLLRYGADIEHGYKDYLNEKPISVSNADLASTSELKEYLQLTKRVCNYLRLKGFSGNLYSVKVLEFALQNDAIEVLEWLHQTSIEHNVLMSPVMSSSPLRTFRNVIKGLEIKGFSGDAAEFYTGDNCKAAIAKLKFSKSELTLLTNVELIATLLHRVISLHAHGFTLQNCDLDGFIWDEKAKTCKIVGLGNLDFATDANKQITISTLARNILNTVSEIPYELKQQLLFLEKNPAKLEDVLSQTSAATGEYSDSMTWGSATIIPSQPKKLIVAKSLLVQEAITPQDSLQEALIKRYVSWSEDQSKTNTPIPANIPIATQHLIGVLSDIPDIDISSLLEELKDVQYSSGGVYFKTSSDQYDYDIYAAVYASLKYILDLEQPSDSKVLRKLIKLYINDNEKLFAPEFFKLSDASQFLVAVCYKYQVNIKIHAKNEVLSLGDNQESVTLNIAQDNGYFALEEVDVSDVSKDASEVLNRYEQAAAGKPTWIIPREYALETAPKKQLQEQLFIPANVLDSEAGYMADMELGDAHKIGHFVDGVWHQSTVHIVHIYGEQIYVLEADIEPITDAYLSSAALAWGKHLKIEHIDCNSTDNEFIAKFKKILQGKFADDRVSINGQSTNDAIIIAARAKNWDLVKILALSNPESIFAYEHATGLDVLGIVTDGSADQGFKDSFARYRYLRVNGLRENPSVAYAIAHELHKDGWMLQSELANYKLRAQYYELINLPESRGGYPFTRLELENLSKLLEVKIVIDNKVYGHATWPTLIVSAAQKNNKMNLVRACIGVCTKVPAPANLSDKDIKEVIDNVAQGSMPVLAEYTADKVNQLQSIIDPYVTSSMKFIMQDQIKDWRKNGLKEYKAKAKVALKKCQDEIARAITAEANKQIAKLDKDFAKVEAEYAESLRRVNEAYNKMDHERYLTIVDNYKKQKHAVTKQLAVTLAAIPLVIWAAPYIAPTLGIKEGGFAFSVFRGGLMYTTSSVATGTFDLEGLTKALVAAGLGYGLAQATASALGNITTVGETAQEFINAAAISLASSAVNNDFKNALAYAVLSGTIQVSSAAIADFVVPSMIESIPETAMREAQRNFVLGASASVMTSVSNKVVFNEELDFTNTVVAGLNAILVHMASKAGAKEPDPKFSLAVEPTPGVVSSQDALFSEPAPDSISSKHEISKPSLAKGTGLSQEQSPFIAAKSFWQERDKKQASSADTKVDTGSVPAAKQLKPLPRTKTKKSQPGKGFTELVPDSRSEQIRKTSQNARARVSGVGQGIVDFAGDVVSGIAEVVKQVAESDELYNPDKFVDNLDAKQQAHHEKNEKIREQLEKGVDALNAAMPVHSLASAITSGNNPLTHHAEKVQATSELITDTVDGLYNAMESGMRQSELQPFEGAKNTTKAVINTFLVADSLGIAPSATKISKTLAPEIRAQASSQSAKSAVKQTLPHKGTTSLTPQYNAGLPVRPFRQSLPVAPKSSLDSKLPTTELGIGRRASVLMSSVPSPGSALALGAEAKGQGRVKDLINKFEVKATEDTPHLSRHKIIERNVSTGGFRNEIPLTVVQKQLIIDYAKKLGMREEGIIFTDNGNTAYKLMFGEIDYLQIGTDVAPSEAPGLPANSRISIKGAIAHELMGHRAAELAGKTQANNLLEEVQASIRAARFAPELSGAERIALIRDALERLRKNGKRIREVKGELWIENESPSLKRVF